MILKCEDISMSFGPQTLFEGLGLQINAGEKWGLVGPNGAGKTTLLNIIMGEIAPDTGLVSFAKDAKLGYLEQVSDISSNASLFEEVLSSFKEIKETEKELKRIQNEVSTETDEKKVQSLLGTIAHLQEQFERLDGYTLESRAREILSGLGFSESDLSKPASFFSGGWLMRMRLAKLLLQQPTILLLDEPTNHLDLVSVTWLEKYVNNYSGSLLLVSHDRAFMNNTVGHIAALENRRLTTYHGNYERYTRLREENLEQMRLKRAAQERDIAHMQTFVNKFRYKATKAKAAQERIARIEKIKAELVEIPESHRAVRFSFPEPARTSDPVVELKQVSKWFDSTKVYTDLDLTLYRGDKIVLVGPNGAGKSTLLKLIGKQTVPTAGKILWGNNVACSYYAQHQMESLNPQGSVLREITEASHGWTNTEIRKLLGSFLFKGDDVLKKVSVLSGGEKARLALAKMLVCPNPLLCLDEPTNHLDIESVEVLEHALASFKGTIVLISHDEELVRSLATKVIEVGKGSAKAYDGDYAYYLSKKAEEEGLGPARPSTQELQAAHAIKPKEGQNRKTKAQKRAEAELRNKLYRAQKDTQEQLQRIEKELEQKQARYDDLVNQMAKPSFYEDKLAFEKAMVEYGELKTIIEELEASWLTIQMKLEQTSE